MRLNNKIAVVTGAGSGIGKAIADKFVEEGAKVVYSDINEIGEILSENGFFVKCDVSDSAQVDSLIKQAVEKFGKIDIMVNNAGIGSLGGILETDDATWQKTLDINLSGVFYGLRAAARYMKENNIKGSIISMSSILGKVGLPGAIAYCAAKGGIIQLTHAASLDLASFSIRVNAIAPGFIKTNMTKDVLNTKEFDDMVTSSTPLGHVGETIDIANAALYLAADESAYVTGAILSVDGGWTAR